MNIINFGRERKKKSPLIFLQPKCVPRVLISVEHRFPTEMHPFDIHTSIMRKLIRRFDHAYRKNRPLAVQLFSL